MDVALGGACLSRTQWRVSRTGVDGRTPGIIDNFISIIEKSSLTLIGTIGTNPPCGRNLSQEVGNIRQLTFQGLVKNSQKLDAVVDRKFSNNRDLTSIFLKVISEKLSYCYRQDIYTRFRMNTTVDPVQTQTPQFVDLGLYTINALDEGSSISTPATKIRRPTDGDHRSSPNHIFSETTATVVIMVSNLEQK